MGIEIYKNADCKRFRAPVIDSSEIQKTIEKMIMDAWRSGSNPNQILNDIVNNSELANKLKEEVGKSLGFQEAHVTSQIDAETKLKLNQYNSEQQQKLTEVTGSFAVKIEEKEKEAATVASQLYQESSALSYEQQQLEEMRARISGQLEELGGEEGIDKLTTINTIVASDEPVVKEKKPTLEKVVAAETKEKEPGLIIIEKKTKYHVFKKIWEYLNKPIFGKKNVK